MFRPIFFWVLNHGLFTWNSHFCFNKPDFVSTRMKMRTKNQWLKALRMKLRGSFQVWSVMKVTIQKLIRILIRGLWTVKKKPAKSEWNSRTEGYIIRTIYRRKKTISISFLIELQNLFIYCCNKKNCICMFIVMFVFYLIL